MPMLPKTPKPMDGPPPQAPVDHIRRKWLDLPYASLSAAQKLDLYLPEEGDGPFPLIFHIHGGAFEMGDKRDSYLSSYLRALDRGYAVASVNYRLSGEAVFPAAVMDLKAALRWLRANHRAYLLDGERIAACGGSAGGNLAAMLALTPRVRALEDCDLGNGGYRCDVQAAVDMFGPTDFLAMKGQLAADGLGPAEWDENDMPETRYLGAPISSVPDKVAQANPMTYIHPEMPPLLIQHGRIDHLVSVRQSMSFVEALRKAVPAERFEFDILEGADHGDPLFETEANMERIFAFLDRYLKEKS
jgi:acetyl esterase/lipase